MTPLDLSDLQRLSEKILDQQNLVAAGPLSAAAVAKLFTKSKIVNFAMVGGGVWFATHEISGSVLKVVQDSFQNLQQVLGIFQ